MPNTRTKDIFSIFYIEDSKFDFHFYKTIIEEALSESYEVNVDNSTSLFHAISGIEHKKYDLIIVDLNLLDSNGYDTFKAVNKHAPDECPMIVVTGIEDAEIKEKCISAGARGVYTKGIHERAIISKVMSIVFELNKMSGSVKTMNLAS